MRGEGGTLAVLPHSFKVYVIMGAHRKETGTCSRRTFMAGMAAGAVLPLAGWSTAPIRSMLPSKTPFPISVFSKQLQWLEYDALAETVAEIGFEGIDLTVRPGGHVIPEAVDDDLPRAVEAAQKAGISVPSIVTAITDPADEYTEPILETAAGQDVGVYRMGYLRYDDAAGMVESLNAHRPRIAKLAELNARYGIHGAYQNHDGTNVGAPVWDLWTLLDGLDARWIGVQYDIRHATVEGGHAWPLGFKLLAPYVRNIVVKDFVWAKSDRGWRIQDVPLGEGMVDFKAFFEQVKAHNIQGPISLHYEYPLPGDDGSLSLTDRRKQVIAVMRRDLGRLREMLGEAGLA